MVTANQGWDEMLLVFKLRQGASISRFVGRSVGRSVGLSVGWSVGLSVRLSKKILQLENDLS